MPGNVQPIFTKVARIGFSSLLTAANNVYNGTGTVATIFTCGADGSFLDAIVCRAAGTNAQTVARFYINNGGATTTATNNTLVYEQGLPATTASATVATPDILVQVPQLRRALPPSHTVICHLASVVVGGWYFTALGGDY